MAYSRLERPHGARNLGAPRIALPLASALLGAIALAAAGCADKPASKLGFSVEFACEADRAAAERLAIEVRASDCSGEPVRTLEIARGESPKSEGALGPGSYGFAAAALAGGSIITTGCVVATLPSSEEPRIVLPAVGCDDAGADAGGDAGSEDDAAGDAAPADDAAFDAAGDDASSDAEADAAPPPVCPADCSDSDPCTDDRCESGLCVNSPFTGPRECDGIACTAGDSCNAGTCAPGTPNDGLCPQDADPCTAEACIPGVGCNVSNAENARCEDGVGCTTNDRCSGGICRAGADVCGTGGVCSAASGQCISGGCTSAADCEDGDPCTNDVCSGAHACVRSPRTGGNCDDGNTCTTGDTCSAGTCVGTSTCAAGATCVGSACRCPVDTQLCGDACVDVQTSRSNCGVCGRACGATQTCQNGACRPTGSEAQTCSAARRGGHDYLFCTDNQNWTTARNKCRSWGFGLAIIDDLDENTFVRSGSGSRDVWLGANDLGTNDGCRLDNNVVGEGHWYWASATDTTTNGTALCTVTANGARSCVASEGRFQNWADNQPDNSCNCAFFLCVTESQDCGVLKPTGLWDDEACSRTNAIGYVCESP